MHRRTRQKKDRLEYSQIIWDCKQSLYLDGQLSKDTGQSCTVTDHSRNPVVALHHTSLVLESPPTRISTPTWQSPWESSSGSVALRHSAARSVTDGVMAATTTQSEVQLFSLVTVELLVRSLQAVATPQAHQASSPRLHGLSAPGFVHVWPLQGPNWTGFFHGFAYGDTFAVLFVVLRYFFAFARMYGNSLAPQAHHAGPPLCLRVNLLSFFRDQVSP